MVGVTAALIGSAVVGAGASIISGNKAAKAQTRAAETAAGAQDRSSEVQLQIFNQQRADFAPYREVGAGALNKLADMYGVPRSTGSPMGATGSPMERPSAANGYGTLPTIYGNYGPRRTQPTANTRAQQQGGQQGQMTPGYEGFQASPGYQFRVDEAMKAIERSAAARGSLRSGATMDALQRRVQGVASDEYNTYANRLAALAGVGQSATGSTAAAGANYGNAVQQGAAAQGNIALAAGNARASGYANTGSAINSGIQNLAGAYLYNQGFGGGK